MEIKYTKQFEKWYLSLSDYKVKSAILRRFDKIKNDDYLGDFKSIDIDLYELRIFVSGGIRLYYTIQNGVLVIFLCGGDKSRQHRDIQKAKNLLKELKC